jgi:hypothetical protein
MQKLLAELPGAADVAGGPADCHAGMQGGVFCVCECSANWIMMSVRRQQQRQRS